MAEDSTNTQVKEGTLKNGNPINRERQFGQPNGNKQGKGFWKKESTPRYRLEQMLKMNEVEIKEVMEDPSTPLFDRKVAGCLLNESQFKNLELMINQVYGPPKQKTELSLDQKDCSVSINIKDFKQQDDRVLV